MISPRKLRNIAILKIALLIFSNSLMAQSPNNDQLLKNIPAETLFCVRINNLDNTLSQTDQFLSGVWPVGVSMLAKAQLSSLLGSPQLTGLNTDGNFAVFGTELADQPSQMPNLFVGILAPVTDYKQFIDGITNKTPADENGIIKILSLGNPILLVTHYNNYALVSWANDYDKLVEYKKLMGINTSASAEAAQLINTLDSAEAKLAVSEPLWIYGNIQQASETFGPLLKGALESYKAIFANMQNTNTGIPASSVQNIMNMYISIFETLTNEVKSISLTISPNSNTLNITKTISAKQGTNIAKMFASDSSRQTENNLLPYLDDGAMMNLAFKINTPFSKEAGDLQVNLLTLLSGDSVSREEIKQLMDQSFACLDGPAAYSISLTENSKPPFAGRYIISIKDEEKFNQLLDESSDIMTKLGLMDLYKNMGLDSSFTVNRNIDTYKGISIDSAKFSIKFTDENNPQAQMLEAMYGDGFDYRWCIVNKLFACTIGHDADQTIKDLIDDIQANKNQLGSETKAAISLLPEAEKADFFFTLNALRMVKMGTSMVSSMAPVPIPSINVQSKSNIAIAGKASDGKLTIEAVLPKEHLQEIITTVMTIQQQMMMQNQPSPRI